MAFSASTQSYVVNVGVAGELPIHSICWRDRVGLLRLRPARRMRNTRYEEQNASQQHVFSRNFSPLNSKKTLDRTLWVSV